MPTQVQERERYLNLILDSESEKKIIVAGPGTGKTYTFKRILDKLGPGNYLVLSFIRKLVDDLAKELGDAAEVKTFHAFCKRILHETQGKVDIYPALSEIIQKDAELLDHDYSDFETKFRNLEEEAPEIAFFLARGDYYEYLSFDDSVYRLYQSLKDDNSILEDYDQIIVDEYQDFNKLEVAFLKELENKGPILVAGDDDQAIYEARSSSPEFLREKYNSVEYEIFELPYCSRCPDADGLEDRLEKQYLPFTVGNEELNELYPKIKTITVPVISSIAKYIDVEINKIPSDEIIESNSPDSKYPTVLIIGQRHYLSELQKRLIGRYPQIEFDTKSEEDHNKILDGIRILLKDENSTLGWRILAGELLSGIALKAAIVESNRLTPFIEILEENFKQSIIEVVELIKTIIQESREFSRDEKQILIRKFPVDAELLIKYFSPVTEEELPPQDPEDLTILLRTFEGSKGLSGGHVFIVGANDGSMPKIDGTEIKDIECCKFIVSLTRTRKQCHIVSNKWLNSPKTPDGKEWAVQYIKSQFISLIPEEYIDDLGYKKSKQIK